MWAGGPKIIRFENKKLFCDAGWPDDYGSWWIATINAYPLVLYSTKKLDQVPCGGYLIPVTFFNEENCLE